MKAEAAVIAVAVAMLTGCVSVGTKAEQGMIVRTVGETNMFRPSLSVMEVSKCVQDSSGRYEEVQTGDGPVGCYGQFMPVAVVQGTQAGALTGLGSAAIQGGAIVGGAYLLGDGIRDSGDSTNVSNDSSSKSRSNSASLSSSKASAKQAQGQHQSQRQSQMQTNGMMRGRD